MTSCAWNDTLCSNLSDGTLVARLSERDASYDASVDQVTQMGVDLRAVLDPVDYNSSSLQSVKNAIDLGFHSLYADVWWNFTSGSWGLCPVSVSNCEVTLSDITSLLWQYITSTDTNIGVGFMRLTLRPRSPLTYLPSAAMSSDYFAENLTPELKNRVFGPQDLAAARNANQVVSLGTARTESSSMWPSLREFLLQRTKRIIINIDRTSMPLNSTGLQSWEPLDGAFSNLGSTDEFDPHNTTQVGNINGTLFSELSDHSFRSLTVNSTDSQMLLDRWRVIMGLGYTAVLNVSVNDPTLLALSEAGSWSWAPGEPGSINHEIRKDMLSNQNYTMCAQQTDNGWIVSDCLEHHLVLCKDESAPFSWEVTDDRMDQFDIGCPTGYNFTAPATALEARSAKEALLRASASSAWIDENSLSLQNCWISGGAEAVCPYNVVEGNRNGVALIAVMGSVCFGLIVVMILLEIDMIRDPMRPQRKRRRQLMRDSYK